MKTKNVVFPQPATFEGTARQSLALPSFKIEQMQQI